MNLCFNSGFAHYGFERLSPNSLFTFRTDASKMSTETLGSVLLPVVFSLLAKLSVHLSLLPTCLTVNQKAQISLHVGSFTEFVLINISPQSYLQSLAL